MKKTKAQRIEVIDANEKSRRYILDTALKLQRSIVNSGMYVGSDYQLYRIGNNPLHYGGGVVRVVKEIL